MAEPGAASVLHLRSSTDLAGPDHVILDLAHALPRSGYRAVIAVLADRRFAPPALIAAARARDLEVVEIPTRGPVDLRLVPRIARAARRCGAVAIHAHEPKGQVAAASAARRLGLPMVATHHGWLSRTARERIYERAGLGALARADRVIAVSRPGAEELAGRAGVEAAVIPNGIRFERAGEPAPDGRLRHLGIDPTRPLILGAGRLEAGKGFADLVDAVGMLPGDGGPVLALLGRGGEGARLARRARRRDVELILPGHVEDVCAVMGRARVFALPSHREQCPVALLEAMAAGAPVAAASVGAVPDLLDGGAAGLLVPPANPRVLAGAIARLLADPSLASSLAERGRIRVETRFSSGAMGTAYAAVYDEVSGGRIRR